MKHLEKFVKLTSHTTNFKDNDFSVQNWPTIKHAMMPLEQRIITRQGRINDKLYAC